jgi:hypothetical protein
VASQIKRLVLAKHPDKVTHVSRDNPDMVIALSDIMSHRDIRPYVDSALKTAGIFAPPTIEQAAPLAKSTLIDVDTAISLKYTAGTRQRGEQAYRNVLHEAHATVAAIAKRMNQSYCENCLMVYFPAEGNPGLAVHGPKTLEKMLGPCFTISYFHMLCKIRILLPF